MGTPYVLGHTGKTIGTTRLVHDGAEVVLRSGWAGSPAGFLPVVVVPLHGRLSVRSANTVEAGPNGALVLPADKADAFLNYNGQGYEAPATTYKLLWHLKARPGRYSVEVQYAKAESDGTLELVGGAQPVLLEAKPGTDAARATIQLGSDEEILAITPKEPFVKGTRLPVEVQSIRLTPLQ